MRTYTFKSRERFNQVVDLCETVGNRAIRFDRENLSMSLREDRHPPEPTDVLAAVLLDVICDIDDKLTARPDEWQLFKQYWANDGVTVRLTDGTLSHWRCRKNHQATSLTYPNPAGPDETEYWKRLWPDNSKQGD